MTELSIIIVNYNTRVLTLECVRSIYEQTKGIEFEILVVDNESNDGSAEAIAEEFPGVRLIRPGKNLGFAVANNLAAKGALGDYLLLLNPDTVILNGAIDKLVSFARGHGPGITGGRTLYENGDLNATSCFGLPSPWGSLCQGLGLSAVFPRWRLTNPEGSVGWTCDREAEVGVVTGCFLLIPHELWCALQGFDESFFMYSEDTDLCKRCWEIGHKCRITPQATIIHHGGRSEPCRSEKMVKVFWARAQYMRKHWPPFWSTFGIRMLDVHAGIRAAVALPLKIFSPHARRAYAQWHAVWHSRDAWNQKSGKAVAAPRQAAQSTTLP